MPLNKEGAADLVKRRHPEWLETQKTLRFHADSYEGGTRYAHADYSADPTGMEAGGHPTIGVEFCGVKLDGPYADYGRRLDRNLIMHQSEAASPEGLCVYLQRLARTPPPRMVKRIVSRHLARIFAREVKREVPPALTAWFADVDGLKTTIDTWMRKTVGPMLGLFGHLDLCFDHPAPDEGSPPIITKADAVAAGVDGVVASHILPENMVWWKLDRRRRYAECLVFEGRVRGDDGQERGHYRHWTATESTVYTDRGDVVSVTPHPYRRVPIVRVFDERRFRSKNVGEPRYGSQCELQRAYYNGWSELVLADIYAAHPTMQAPEPDVVNGPDGAETQSLRIGPDGILNQVWRDGQYWPASYLSAPTDGVESQRQHCLDYQDQADRDACLLKPAGSTTGQTVAQSGVSKAFDNQEGNDYLAEWSESLQDVEYLIAEYAHLVLTDGAGGFDLEKVEIVYPKEFDLYSAGDLSAALADIQQLLAAAGAAPQFEAELIGRIIRNLLPGLDDRTFKEIHAEITDAIDAKATAKQEAMEAMSVLPPPTDPDPLINARIVPDGTT